MGRMGRMGRPLAYQLHTRRLNCGRKPDPGRLRQAEACHARVTVRGAAAGDAPPELGAVARVTTHPGRRGERRWFACPGCGERCGVLFQPDPGDPWRCRRCHGLTYRSAQQAHRDELVWPALERIVRHLEAHGGWGEHPEALFAGLKTAAERLAMCQALVYWDLMGLEAEWAARRGGTPEDS
jgi:hypothetical protein